MALQEVPLPATSTDAAARAVPLGLGLEYMRKWAPVVDTHLRRHLATEQGLGGEFAGPLLHLMDAGGKRFRPALTLVACELVGGHPNAALDVACAIECVHTSSLILDDLPCMDDAPLRRGVPAVHATYGESTAILTALVLFNLAHKLLATSEPTRSSTQSNFHSKIADALGANGMIGGQQLDLQGKDQHAALAMSAARLKKTSTLMAAALFAGACVGGGSAEDAHALYNFGEELGCAFQLRDDALDLAEDRAKVDAHDGANGRYRAGSAVGLLRRAFPNADAKRDILESMARLAIARAH